MNLKTWLSIYFRIARWMRYNVIADQLVPLVTLVLNLPRIIPVSHLHKLIRNKTVFVFGAGATLASTLPRFREIYSKYRDSITIVCADAAITPLIEHNILPDIIVTDLDGNIKFISMASKLGSLIILHGHGDNLHQILKFSKYLNRVIISTQLFPIYPIIDYYGYTDGDRAVSLARECGAKKIILIGMDLDDAPDPYHKYKKLPATIKRVKLKIASTIIGLLAKHNHIYQLEGGNGLQDVDIIGWGDLETLLSD